MKLLKGYYAYLAVSGGLVLNLAVQSNWMLRIVAFALVSAGALPVQSASRWYTRASIAADVYMAFSLVLGPAVIRPDCCASRWNTPRSCRCCSSAVCC